MLFHASILAQAEEGILERILRVIRHRGFSMQSLEASPDHSGEKLMIRILAQGTRSQEHLKWQLAKLIHVESVELYSEEQEREGFAVSRSLPLTRRAYHVASHHG